MASLASVDLNRPCQKRKRRRRQDKPAIAARLVLDDHVKGDVGILSEDLFADLFPHLRHGKSLYTLLVPNYNCASCANRATRSQMTTTAPTTMRRLCPTSYMLPSRPGHPMQPPTLQIGPLSPSHTPPPSRTRPCNSPRRLSPSNPLRRTSNKSRRPNYRATAEAALRSCSSTSWP